MSAPDDPKDQKPANGGQRTLHPRATERKQGLTVVRKPRADAGGDAVPRRDGPASQSLRKGGKPKPGGKPTGPRGNAGKGEWPKKDGPRKDGPRKDGPKGARPQGGRPQGDRPGYGPKGDRPAYAPKGDRPRGDGARNDRPRRDHSAGSRAIGAENRDRKARHKGDRPEQPSVARPAQRMGSARGAAVQLLDGVLGAEKLMSEMTGAGGVLDGLEPADRARAQRLATETLRSLERVDRLIQKHLQKYPPLTFHNILRLATYELCTGAAAHGVVNDCVALAGMQPRGDGMKGLVNAVLRKISIEGPKSWDVLRVPRLPVWLRDPLIEAWGNDEVAAMEQAHFNGAALDLTPRDATQAPALAETLGAILLPTESLRLTDPGQVSDLPGFADGQWWVQDAAAAIPARVLNAQPGETVLDLCAAPGGKTMQLAATGATVTALDLSERRMGLVEENLARTGLVADCRNGDALTFGGGPYDAILLDAPCSATGTIRRHPDLPHAKDGSDFIALFELQAQMIDHALTLLKPGGRLVFCTCSLLPDEGECQVDDALERHPGLTVDRDSLALAGVDPAWITEEGGLRLRPDYWADSGAMDGFYIACLRV